MEYIRIMSIRMWDHFMNDSLRRNSSLLIAGQAFNSVTMFLFWIICARLFTASAVGVATTVISLAALVATIARFGVGNIAIRFLPSTKDKSSFFNALLMIAIVGSFLGGVITIIFISSLSPNLSYMQRSYGLMSVFVVLVVANSAVAVTDSTLIAFRKGKYVAIKSLMGNTPILLIPFFVVTMEVEGVVLAYLISLVIGIIYEVVVLRRRFFEKQTLKPSFTNVWDKRNFAIGNYVGGVASLLPTTLLPLIVLENLGAKNAAYFYMPMQLTGFLIVIASSASNALFSEASQDDDESKNLIHLWNALSHTYKLLLPAAGGLVVIGWLILRIYGNAYAVNGFWPLILLCIASLFVAINALGDNWILVKKNMKGYLTMQILNAVLVVIFVYVAVKMNLGLIGVGLGWLLGQLITSLVYVIFYGRQEFYLFKNLYVKQSLQK